MVQADLSNRRRAWCSSKVRSSNGQADGAKSPDPQAGRSPSGCWRQALLFWWLQGRSVNETIG